MSIFIMLVIGLVAGAVAKALMPGDGPGGVIVTMMLGVVGSFVAGLIGRVVGLYRDGDNVGFIASVLGAMLLLVGYRLLVRR